MPTLLDYRRRIRSVKSTQQITRAMKFVAAAKLRRAQEGVFAARPYAREILRVLRSAAVRMETAAHPLLERLPQSRVPHGLAEVPSLGELQLFVDLAPGITIEFINRAASAADPLSGVSYGAH